MPRNRLIGYTANEMLIHAVEHAGGVLSAADGVFECEMSSVSGTAIAAAYLEACKECGRLPMAIHANQVRWHLPTEGESE